MKLLIKQKLIIFSALLILIPLLLSAVFIIWLVKSNIEQQSAQSIEKDARVAEQLFKNRELLLVQVVQNAAQAISAQGLDLSQLPAQGSGPTQRVSTEGHKRLNDLIKNTLQSSKADFIVVTDSQGNIIAPALPAKVEADFKKNPLLLSIQNGAAASKLDAQSSSVKESADILQIIGSEDLSKQVEIKSENGVIKDGLVIEAAAPITSGGGRLSGVVFAGLLLNNARPDQEKSIVDDIKNKLYPEIRAESGAAIALGDIIVSSNLPIQQGGGIGKRIKGELGDKPKAGIEIFDNENYKTAYAPIKDINSQVVGRVGVQIKQSWFNAVLNSVQITIALIVALFLLLAVGAAIYFAQRLTRPIIELTEASNNISLGQLDQAISIKSDDEIGQLAEALERMRISLKQALDRLRARRPAQQ
jgi:HAMP domain-containing protein